jgi:hypothetical protein
MLNHSCLIDCNNISFVFFHQGEAGHEILCLKQFFSNPGNFEKSAKASGMLGI